MSINPTPLNKKREELTNEGYLLFDSDSTNFHSLKDKGPMILDSGVIVFICIAGTAKIAVDINTIDIKRGSFVLLLPYSVVQVIEISEDARIKLVTTGFGFLDKLAMSQPVENYISHIREEPYIHLTEEQLKEAHKIYEFIEQQYIKVQGPLKQEIRNSLMTILALEIVNYFAANQPKEKRCLSHQEQVFRNFTISLVKNIKEHRRVEFYAEEACLTPKYFSKIIKNRSGKLPSEWIAERTVMLIKFLLDNTSKSIQEISHELNFPNQSFFTRYFKGHTGVTPTEYRE
ncbi:AraC family transcriptional activator of pobA [Dysgonomonadaceae bacterium PH5-43]|nr:AraC family transcriptional activator of pobA [Dysgonomonadaceae bacterium PH5-43]